MDLFGIEDRARAVVDTAAFNYVAGGADDELTLTDNVVAWSRYRLRPRMLRGVGVPDLRTTVLGQPVASPVLVAPTAFHRLVHPAGELATAVGAARAGTVMVLSTTASSSMEDVAASAPHGARWFQLYVHTDRDLTLSLLHRAETAGYRALVLTVDTRGWVDGDATGPRVSRCPTAFARPTCWPARRRTWLDTRSSRSTPR